MFESPPVQQEPAKIGTMFRQTEFTQVDWSNNLGTTSLPYFTSDYSVYMAVLATCNYHCLLLVGMASHNGSAGRIPLSTQSLC